MAKGDSMSKTTSKILTRKHQNALILNTDINYIKYHCITENQKKELEKLLYDFAVKNKIGWVAICDPFKIENESNQ